MSATYIFIFNSVHKVMKAEKLLRNAGIASKTIPVPRKLSADCGLAIRISGAGLDRITASLAEAPAEEVYVSEGDDFRRVS